MAWNKPLPRQKGGKHRKTHVKTLAILAKCPESRSGSFPKIVRIVQVVGPPIPIRNPKIITNMFAMFALAKKYEMQYVKPADAGPNKKKAEEAFAKEVVSFIVQIKFCVQLNYYHCFTITSSIAGEHDH